MMNNDLISRSALLAGFDVRKVTEYDESGCGMDYIAVPVEAINNAPAVDAEPVRHGRWVHVKTDTLRKTKYYCSECGHWLYVRNGGRSGMWAHYCPNCGAKMVDAEVQNEKV